MGRKTPFQFRTNADYDLALVKQVEALNPFKAPTKAAAKLIWEQIAETLRSSSLQMDVTARSCKDRIILLMEKRRKEAYANVAARQKSDNKSLQCSQLEEADEDVKYLPFSESSVLVENDNDGDQTDRNPLELEEGGAQEAEESLSTTTLPVFFAIPGLPNNFMRQQNENCNNSNPNSVDTKLNMLAEQIQALEAQLTRLLAWTTKQDGINNEILSKLRNANTKLTEQMLMANRRQQQPLQTKHKSASGNQEEEDKIQMPFVLLKRLPAISAIRRTHGRPLTRIQCVRKENIHSADKTALSTAEVAKSADDDNELDDHYLEEDLDHEPLLNIKTEFGESASDEFITPTMNPDENEGTNASLNTVKDLEKNTLVDNLVLQFETIQKRRKYVRTNRKKTKINYPSKEFENLRSTIKQKSQKGRRAYLSKFAKDKSQPINCELCGKFLKTKVTWQMHQVLAHGIGANGNQKKKYKCSSCPKSYVRQALVKQHYRIVHENIRDHLCTICGSTFARLTNLRLHAFLHSNEKKFKCKYCDSTFKQSTGLKAHENLHLVSKRGKPQCTQCGQLFTKQHSLNKHIKIVHEKIRRFACQLCTKAFKEKSHLAYHLRTHSNPIARKRGLNRDHQLNEDSSGGVPKVGRVGRVSNIKQVSDEEIQEEPIVAAAGGAGSTVPTQNEVISLIVSGLTDSLFSGDQKQISVPNLPSK